jgi:Cu/Ag efflux protein CusF
MKVLATACVLFLAGSVAFAQSTAQPASGQATPASGQQPAMGADKAKAKEFTAEIVSIDQTAKTITFNKKGDATASAGAGIPMTLPVDDKADLSKYKAGDQVKLVCKADDTGKEVVKRIEKADTRPATDAPPNPTP